MSFDFITTPRIIFGLGRIREIGSISIPFGRRVLIFSSKGGASITNLLDILKTAGLECEVMEVEGEPTVDMIRLGVAFAKKIKCDLIIGFGGGSVIDTGKAVSVMLTNPGEVEDYLEVVGKNQTVTQTALPMIAIPTTAGTGCEVTRNAVLVVPQKKVKVSLRSPLLLPRVALIDPELTFTVPPEVTAATGMDALAQVLEPYVSIRSNSFTDLFCREGMARAACSLRQAFYKGDDQQARENMAFTSLMGGLALANAGLGAVHGFAAPIGGMYNAPHGAVCARLLPPVVSVNVRALKKQGSDHPALERYQEVAKMLTGNQEAKIEDGIEWLEQLCRDLQIPPLSWYGMSQESIPELVVKAARTSSMKGNPVQLTEEELKDILNMAL